MFMLIFIYNVYTYIYEIKDIVCWIFTLSSLDSKVCFNVSILKRISASLNNVCKAINFHLNGKWTLCAYCVAGALLHGSIMMNSHRHSSGLMEQLDAHPVSCRWQLTHNGGIWSGGRGQSCSLGRDTLELPGEGFSNIVHIWIAWRDG